MIHSFFFFFKQKTAYEMRISDWSSDVCSSDLLFALATTALVALPLAPIGSPGWRVAGEFPDNFAEQVGWPELVAQVAAVHHALPEVERARPAIYATNYGEARSAERRGRNRWGHTSSLRWSPNQ